jgi:protein-S-isoprenylcysteine O-methyltransferase Ste14
MALKVPPLLVVALAAASMWIIARLLPGAPGIPGGMPAAVVLTLTGLLVTMLGVVAFRRARTTVNPMDPGAATELVETGVYRFTRNPMYLGFGLVLLGWAVALSSLPALLSLAAYVLYIDRFQIAPEERALERVFGERYLAYRGRVRRWI